MIDPSYIGLAEKVTGKRQNIMLKRLALFIITVLLCVSLVPAYAQIPKSASTWEPSIAFQWWDVAFKTVSLDVARHQTRPTVSSRALGILGTAMFDAWATYDEKAIGTRLGGTLRRPVSELTLANKTKAISFAAYRTLVDIYPEESTYLASQMRKFGFNPEDDSTDKTNPQGIGNTVAAALLEYRHHDGANQLGDELGSNGLPYSDYTLYQPINTVDKIVDPNRWQPITFVDSKGGTRIPPFSAPHWYRVKPFALLRPDQFRPPAQPKVGSEQLYQEAQQVLEMSANLTPEQKALVEFMRDAPGSDHPGLAGLWLSFGQGVARRNKHTLDQDIKLFFALSGAAMDSFIAGWDAKRYYDSSRPWTLIHYLFDKKYVRAWGGPGKGTIKMLGNQWYPYSPPSLVTPPFPSYVAAHGVIGGACAEILRFFSGDDYFGESFTMKAGALTEPGFETNVTLSFPTFTSIAEASALSGVYGGTHIPSDATEGLKLGRKVGKFVLEKALGYINGN